MKTCAICLYEMDDDRIKDYNISNDVFPLCDLCAALPTSIAMMFDDETSWDIPDDANEIADNNNDSNFLIDRLLGNIDKANKDE